jgi:hypothetical protein
VGGQSGWVSVEGGGIRDACQVAVGLLCVEWFARFSFLHLDVIFVSGVLLCVRACVINYKKNVSVNTMFVSTKNCTSCIFRLNYFIHYQRNSILWMFLGTHVSAYHKSAYKINISALTNLFTYIIIIIIIT